MIDGRELTLFYQSRRSETNHRWRYGIARCHLDLPLPQVA
jgi:hypothetical protein